MLNPKHIEFQLKRNIFALIKSYTIISYLVYKQSKILYRPRHTHIARIERHVLIWYRMFTSFASFFIIFIYQLEYKTSRHSVSHNRLNIHEKYK